MYPNHASFTPDMFGPYLPQKLMVLDKKVKECQEVKVEFTLLKTWKEQWPTVKIVKIKRH